MPSLRPTDRDTPALGGSRRYMQVAETLIGDIRRGDLVPGQRLRPERDLAAALGVSRTTIREAMLALELMGHVEIRVGSGVYVLPDALRSGRGSIEPAQDGPWEILEARRAIEGETAFRAAQRITDAGLAELSRTIDRMNAAMDDLASFDIADAEFHAGVARAAENGLLAGYVSQLWSMRTGPLWGRWYDRTRSRANRRRSIEDHRAIWRALSRHDCDAARTAMQAHLDVLAERFLALELNETDHD